MLPNAAQNSWYSRWRPTATTHGYSSASDPLACVVSHHTRGPSNYPGTDTEIRLLWSMVDVVATSGANKHFSRFLPVRVTRRRHSDDQSNSLPAAALGRRLSSRRGFPHTRRLCAAAYVNVPR